MYEAGFVEMAKKFSHEGDTDNIPIERFQQKWPHSRQISARGVKIY